MMKMIMVMVKQMKKIVIFDFDGTIGDTLPLGLRCFHEAIEPLANKRLTDEEIIETFGPTEEGTIMQLIPEHYEEGVKKYLECYEKYHDMCATPFDGIKDLIACLRDSNVKTALVTGKGKKSCDISLKQYDMENSFDWIEVGSLHGTRKAEGIRNVLEHFRIRPKDAAYVGDAPSDITYARQEGVSIISALWGSHTDEQAIKKGKPDFTCYKVEELKQYLEQQLELE